ncbi:MAG: hypothetical protein H0U24_07490 [Thermoleophilaceae bacterium]|nr:hypothetical protein [Thermoleophilaceae bacterium]
MKLTTRLAAGALMATLVAVPATAEAKPVSKVRAQVVAADKSLDRVVSLASRNRDTAAARELRRYRRHLRSAEGQVRRLRGSTGSLAGAESYGRSVRMVGSVANECADSLSQIVAQVGGDPQVAIAQAIKACIVTRERVVEVLTQMLDQVPAEARPYLAQVIALLSSDGKDEVQALTVALGNPALPVDVAAILTQALALATDAINDAIGRLQGIVGMLPASAQPIVNTALTLVTGQLQMVTTLVRDLFTGLFGGAPTAPGGTTGVGSLGGLFGAGGLPGLNVLQGMFANASR